LALLATALAFGVACGAVGQVPVASTTAIPTPRCEPPACKRGASPPLPEDFPSSPLTLNFNGPISAALTTGRPSACGSGQGPTGSRLFEFGTYFLVGSTWYVFTVTTVRNQVGYSGPGTYPALATIGQVQPNGTSTPIFGGSVALLIVSDRAPDSGSVAGTLVDPSGNREIVSGGWTCTFTPLLGPG
jgi:hypothetical protein